MVVKYDILPIHPQLCILSQPDGHTISSIYFLALSSCLDFIHILSSWSSPRTTSLNRVVNQ